MRAFFIRVGGNFLRPYLGYRYDMGMKLHTIDTRFQAMPQVIAVYLVIGPEGPVLIESGPGSTIPAVVSALADYDLRPADIRAVLLSHIHLDHAGAAGWWASQGAQIYVHHVGLPHLVDPSKLMASATRIYGDRMDALWGQMIPVPAEQATAVYDGQTVEAGGLTFTALDTPGHANHHHAWLLRDYAQGTIAFTGDAAGIHLPAATTGHIDVADLPAPPPEFHMETWLQTLGRLAAAAPVALYPTHFDRIDDVHGHLSSLRTLMIDTVAFVEERFAAAKERDEIVSEFMAWRAARAAAQRLSPTTVEQYALANPPVMSVDGILRYLRRKGSSG